MDLLERLLVHDEWATTQILEMSRSLTDERLDQPFDIGHGTLRETFEHMIVNVDGWMARMIGRPPEDRGDDRSLAALTAWHERAYATFAAFARQRRDAGDMETTFADPFGGDMTYGGAILHVILHNAEHRTELVHILTRLGLPEVPEVDHGLWDYVRRGF